MTRGDSDIEARVADRRAELDAALRGLYGDHGELVDRLIGVATDAGTRRSTVLRRLDHRRTVTPDWFLQPQHVGYTAYVDRFGGDLTGVRSRLPYLADLGVDMLHLLSLFAPRVGDNDGGYAIRDYLRPDPRIGTSADLDALIADVHDADISLVADFVLNHTSDDHPWAIAARGGSARHRDLYITFPDRIGPDAYEAALPEVFPQLAPGNFTYVDEMDRWVWTTFREYQWDLDWSNPDVLVEVATIACELANLGVDVLRLDAIAFTWKRLGTNCQNQPEVHLIAQALRAVVGIAAPATILLAEAIVGPDDLVGYLGRHEFERRECEIAYHNQLMVQSWSMLAAGEVGLAQIALDRLAEPPATTTWFTYTRCHDDIGWAIDDADAVAAGVSGAGHRAFLAAFYRGDFPMSFARGTPFASNAETGDERTSGMAATLAGVAAALDDGDPVALALAERRLLLLAAISFGYGGIPLIYMGDELAQLDDLTAAEDPLRADDTRWLHRPSFDVGAADRRGDHDTIAGRTWAGIRLLVEARRGCRPLHGAGSTRPIDVGSSHVFAWHRLHPRFGGLVGIANVTAQSQSIDVDHVTRRLGPSMIDRLDRDDESFAELAPYQVRWLTGPADLATVPPPGARPIPAAARLRGSAG